MMLQSFIVMEIDSQSRNSVRMFVNKWLIIPNPFDSKSVVCVRHISLLKTKMIVHGRLNTSKIGLRYVLSSRKFATSAPNKKLAVLCILDGWGYSPVQKNNSVLLAKAPNYEALWGHHAPRKQIAFLEACEKWVGLPEGQIGNSEVGHMNIGAGRIVWQDICTIENAIEDGSLPKQEALLEHIAKLKKSGGTCHLMGLVSPGGVHSMQDHMIALANAVTAGGVPVIIHAFTDGRDVPPQDAINTMPTFVSQLPKGATVGTLGGRYYGMDRDNRWERVGKAVDAIMSGKGESSSGAVAAIEKGYAAGQNDEFILPTVIDGYKGMKDGDGILMANFRADRAREILKALADPEPPTELEFGKSRPQRPKFADVSGMVQYSDRHKTYMSALFPEKEIKNVLGEVVANAGLNQLRMAETEKYPHVTFFFNGGREAPFKNEDRILVPSPKVATYDLQPEMSAREVCDKLCAAIDSDKYSLVIVNFANPDMVGHTGVLSAAITAVETVDECLGRLAKTVEKHHGVMLITADHGNCEQMWDDEINGPHTAHTLNRVPVIVADYSETGRDLKVSDGSLCDIAPTILQLLDIKQPADMSGRSLIVPPEKQRTPKGGNAAYGN